ncbi:MAG: DUF5320 domain-containing protein [Candidatus Omnitrophica bacterium]|nr:DUF5320 domain-containing protein [Candidatus Omnitrophota bacterium]
MPGGDGTGPMGMGPMTGRAAGYCTGYSMPGYANPIPGRGWGFGFGRGRGWGRGFGRGFGRRWAVYPYAYGAPSYPAYPYGSELTAKEEADMLKDQAKAMEEEIKAINDRISALEKSQGSKED